MFTIDFSTRHSTSFSQLLSPYWEFQVSAFKRGTLLDDYFEKTMTKGIHSITSAGGRTIGTGGENIFSRYKCTIVVHMITNFFQYVTTALKLETAERGPTRVIHVLDRLEENILFTVTLCLRLQSYSSLATFSVQTFLHFERISVLSHWHADFRPLGSY